MGARNSHLVVGSLALVAVVVVALWYGYSLLQGKDPEPIRALGTPILLIHGLSGSADTWTDSGYVEYLEGLGLGYGGVVRAERGRPVAIREGRVAPEEGEMFVFEVSDSWASLELWQEELREVVVEVTRRTGLPRVVLVGHSAGGVAARRYLVEHPKDHRVARLVTISSPHGGSELAVAAELQRSVGRLPLGRAATDVLERWEREHDLRPDSPLLRELLPPEDGNYLDRLNRSPHPTDVDYACVIATGTEVGADWKRLQMAFARTRNGEKAESLGELVATRVMRLLAQGTANDSEAGDGAVLLASQHLGRVEFFRRHPETLRAALLVPGGHEQAKFRYPAITRAVGDSVEFLRARTERRGAGDVVLVDFRSPLAGLAQVSAEDGDGRRLAAGAPALYSDGKDVFARVEIGPLPDGGAEIRLRVRPPDAPLAHGATVARRGRASPAGAPEPRPYELALHTVLGAAGKRWDRVGDPGADLQAVLRVDGQEIFRTDVLPDVADTVLPGFHGSVTLDPRRSRVELLLWDVDALGAAPETMATVVWKPGQLAPGRTLLATEQGLGLDVELLPTGGDRTLWRPEPLYW
jgi:pimeloyl-ACP methyl ester carboxylesterase